MPRKHDIEDVRQKFIAAGYIPDNDFAYRNNKQKHRVFDILNNKYVRVSLQQLNYHVGKGNRPLWEQPAVGPEPLPLTSLERFARHHDQAFQQLPIEAQQDTFNDYQQLRRSIGRKRDFDYVFHDADSEAAQTTQMRAIVLALQDSLPKLLSKGLSIRLKITTTNGLERYFHVNATTLSDLWLMFSNVEPDFSVEDSSGNFALSTLNIATIHFTFKKSTKGKQVAAGFFPYVGTTTAVGENLERLEAYGIYSIDNLAKAVEPCLLTAFRASNIMTDNELQQLQEMINVREFPQRYLKNISEHFNISIYVRLYRDDEQGKSKSSHVEFKPSVAAPNGSAPVATRAIKLMIMHGHYMLYEIMPNRKSNYQLIKDMIKAGQLRPYTDKELEQLYAAVARSRPQPAAYRSSRPKVVKIPQPKRTQSLRFYGEHLFGYKPEADEIAERLDQLQKFVNSLPLRHHVNVRDYFKFSMLMERIMYEFGCFDNVHELSGQLRDDIRASLVFPKRSEPPAELTNDRYYYLDFNGAYCSFMDRIDGNTKIKQLIELMYERRLNADKRLAKTIKFLMCSCFGSSISKPKTHKHKWSDNIEATIRNQGNLVASHAGGSSGFVTLLNPYVEHYSYPQFAKVILDGFNNKVNELKSIVNVLFQNIDAFVVNEADYKKLLELGYIHPTELGKLKVEHVFTKMTFKNKMRWVGINEDGTEFRHCM